MTNSFQATRKPKSTATPRPGSDSGRTMRTRVPETQAVDPRRVDQVVGEVAEEAGKDPDHQRQDDRHVTDDEVERRIDEARWPQTAGRTAAPARSAGRPA